MYNTPDLWQHPTFVLSSHHVLRPCALSSDHAPSRRESGIDPIVAHNPTHLPFSAEDGYRINEVPRLCWLLRTVVFKKLCVCSL
jgi:hypothetical protein